MPQKKSAGSGVHGKASTYRPAGSMPDVATFICSRCAHVQTVHTVPGVWYKVSYVVNRAVLVLTYTPYTAR